MKNIGFNFEGKFLNELFVLCWKFFILWWFYVVNLFENMLVNSLEVLEV